MAVKRPGAMALLMLLTTALFSPVPAGAVTLEEVNPFIGTGGKGYGVGNTWPGPCVPFGLARPGPDTAKNGTAVSFYHCGGYYYGDNQVRGFSSTRLSGIGVPDYGNVTVMPTPRRSGDPGRQASYRARFRHERETASPGYYAVTLEGPEIRSELTATAHCGLYRFTYPRGRTGGLLIDARTALAKHGVCAAEVTDDPGRREIFGRVLSCGSLTRRAGGAEIFFVVRVGAPFATVSKREDAGVWLELDSPEPVEVAVGLSLISVDQARRHIEEEIGGRSFDQARAEAEAKWRQALGTIEVTGGTPEQRRIFATALYHAQIMPTDVTEAGGLYRGFDEQVHAEAGRSYYTDFSLWDTFRTLHPLLLLIQPERSADMMESLTLMGAQGGVIPRWPTAYRYTGCMIGDNAANVIAEAYLKGVRNFNAEAAYATLRAQALSAPAPDSGLDRREGLEEYIRSGYVPADRYSGAAAWTIEMSYNDYCLGLLAGALGKAADEKIFLASAGNWRNLWDPKTGYLRGRRADGSFASAFAPWAWTGDYVEGNARQWTWAPLHDAAGLIELMGGPGPFAERLDGFFVQSAQRPDTMLWDNFYWHGNEPDIHAAYLFDYAGRPDLTAQWVRWIMAAKYRDAPDGIDGNDDCGTLSAWYIFSALGFYPVAGTDRYLIGSPIFERAVVHLGGGDLVITAGPDPGRNQSVSSVTLNGRPLALPWFRHAEIAGGGELNFSLDRRP
jgi:predicted alpha-1,2-mannosidase